MSRRRGPRGRERDTTSNQSQQILQVVLIGAGVLFLLIGAVIAAGINLPGTGALSNTGDDSSSASTPDPEQTPTATSEMSSDTTTEESTETTTTTEEPTETTTTTEEPTETTTTTEEPTQTSSPTQTTTEATRTATSGGLSIVDTTDQNGNGYVSDFDITVRADTRLAGMDSGKNGDPYLAVQINGQQFGRTDILKQRTADGVFSIDVKPSDLARYDRGQLQITVQLMDRDPGQDEQVDSWTQTVNYEPE
ncbi:C2 domain-containing protein [Halocatena pleomorpha]|uniref:C2 domain-containing protein n=1 Tax=Halocatena pleomorpha TaxID=1785090 RepID=A0A3P3R6A7_9EURY|nr:hypothetical protein [Halocatena pleomorpha]RRJ28439.1 hypothetical protein EIK79_15835 [Halocatena pleomorpha]